MNDIMSFGKENLEEIDERKLVNILGDLFLKNRPPFLKKIFIHTNLATRKFQKIWIDWWITELPPKLEIDLIPIFEEYPNSILIAGIEVKFFKEKGKNPYDGLQQVLSFGLFGFDSLVLWHIFSDNLENKTIETYVKPLKEIIEGFELPVVYIATKLTEDLKFEFFAPWELYSSLIVDAEYFLQSLMNLCEEEKNPLLKKGETEKRRRCLKIILKIPI